MGIINVLDTKTANAIKAGEVIERPVSVVKELFDNAVDSRATRITVEFSGGGIAFIRVTDNGVGMDSEDARKAFLIHATSKLSKIDDILSLTTMGFRGEALASIAACSDVTLVTGQSEGIATRITYEDGNYTGSESCNAAAGTTVEVRNLFANYPARYKFLKKDSTEGMYITGIIEKLAVVNPSISVKLVKDSEVQFTTPGTGSMLDAVYAVYGKQTANALIPVDYHLESYTLSGFCGNTSYVRGNRGLQCIYVNERVIRSKTITAAIDEAYKNAVMKNRFPVCFLKIDCAPGSVDVNVHPQKAEVRFENDSTVFRLVCNGIRDALNGSGQAGFDFLGAQNNGKDGDNISREPVSNAGTQIRMDVHKLTDSPSRISDSDFRASGSVAGDSASASKLLKILSAFKPNPDEISRETQGSYTEDPVTVKPDVNEADDRNSAERIIESEDTDDDISLLRKADFVGFLFTTYMIFQSESDVFFVDQHAAHERILYEKYMAKMKPGTKPDDIESLLVPQIVPVSAQDYAFISDHIDDFADNGFEIELLGDREIALRTMPFGTKSSPATVFEQIMDDLKKDVPAKSQIWYALMQTTACKAAIRAGEVITREEALSLVDSMTRLDDPYHCAHGRPTFFRISRRDFEKNFRRIV